MLQHTKLGTRGHLLGPVSPRLLDFLFQVAHAESEFIFELLATVPHGRGIGTGPVHFDLQAATLAEHQIRLLLELRPVIRQSA
jgi:hypothetical protein